MTYHVAGVGPLWRGIVREQLVALRGERDEIGDKHRDADDAALDEEFHEVIMRIVGAVRGATDTL